MARAGSGDEEHAAARRMSMPREVLVLVVEEEALVEAADGVEKVAAHEHGRAPDVVYGHGRAGGALNCPLGTAAR